MYDFQVETLIFKFSIPFSSSSIAIMEAWVDTDVQRLWVYRKEV